MVSGASESLPLCHVQSIVMLTKMTIGPVVRFNPREIHIKDLHYYEEIYVGGSRKRDKDSKYLPASVVPTSTIATLEHDHHRRRRGFIANFFSKHSVRRLESLIQDKVDLLVRRLKSAHTEGAIVNLYNAFGAMTADMTTHYLYGASLGYLDDPGFGNDMLDGSNSLFPWIHVIRFTPILVTILQCVPVQFLQRLGLALGSFIKIKSLVRQLAVETLQKKKKIPEECQRTIFDALAGAHVPYEEKGLDRLETESLTIFGAGTETTARTLSVAFLHLSNNASSMLRLREEIQQVMPLPSSPASWIQLEMLPYLVLSPT
jgi:cytochrome P450